MRRAICALASALLLAACSGAPAVDLPQIDLTTLEPDVADALRTTRDAAVEEPTQRNLLAFGVALFAHRRHAAAEPVLLAAAEREGPETFESLYLAGLSASDTSEERAIAIIERALRVRGDYAPALVKCGLFLEGLGRIDEAAAKYRRALDLDRERFTLIGLGRCALANGDLREAVALLEEARIADPEAREASVALARAYTRLGWEREAAQASAEASVLKDASPIPDPLMEAVLGTSVSYQGRLLAANRAAMSDDVPRALRILDALVESSPERPGAHLAAGTLLASIGRDPDALRAFDAVLAMDADHVEARARKAASLARLGEIAEAERLLRETVAASPESTFARYELASVLATTAPAEALQMAQQLVADRPGSRSGRLLLARLLAIGGALDEASEHVTWVLTRYHGDQDAADLARFISSRRGADDAR